MHKQGAAIEMSFSFGQVKAEDGELPYISVFKEGGAGRSRVEVARVLEAQSPRGCQRLARLLVASPRMYEALVLAKELLRIKGVDPHHPAMAKVERAIQIAQGSAAKAASA